MDTPEGGRGHGQIEANNNNNYYTLNFSIVIIDDDDAAAAKHHRLFPPAVDVTPIDLENH
jgi:hypothetical protein